MPRYVNTVPQGIAGTGNATIFGDNPVAAQFGNQLAALRQRELQDELRKQQQAEKLAQDLRAHQLKVSKGMLWAPEMSQLEQAHLKEGADLQASGIYPYGNHPKALEYQQKQALIESMQGYRNALEEEEVKSDAYIRANLDKLDPQSIRERTDFFKSTSLKDAFNKNLRPSDIRNRFDIKDSLKDLKAAELQIVKPNGDVITDKTTRDTPKTQDIILGKLASGNPQEKAEYEKITSGVPVAEIRALDSTAEGNAFNLRRVLSENAHIRAQWAREHGLRPFTKEYDKAIDDIAAEQAKIKKNFENSLKPLVDMVSSGLKEIDKTTAIKPEMTEYQKAQLKLAEQRLGIQRQNAAKKGADTTATNTRVDLIQRIQRGEPGALEEVVADINGNPEYDKTDKAKILNKDGKFFLHVPRKIKLDSEGNEVAITQSNDYPVVHNDPSFISYVNSLIGNTTGAKVDLGSIGAKSSNLKKSPPLPAKAKPATAPVKKSINLKDLPAKAKAAGYTNREYEDLLRKNGVEIIP